MSKVLNVRIEDNDFKGIEERDKTRYPTQSDYVREALRRLRLEERRNRIRAEAKRLARDPGEMREMKEIANARLDGLVERWEKADRGEI